MRIRTLIVDDEYPAREELRFLLSKYPEIEVVGEATNATEAITLIRAVDYHLVFLDINFPTSNGIEIGMEIKKEVNAPLIIYVTAHEDYALKAFDVDVVDYILKPIDKNKLDRAIERVVADYRKRNDAETPTSTDREESLHDEELLTRLTAEYKGKMILVDVKDIIYIYTEDNYVFIKTFDKQLISRYTLSMLAEKLDSKTFFRAHRGYIVNLDKVLELAPSFQGTYSLVVADKEESKIPVSRNQTKELRKLLLF
jgi:two-component system LytT family response regulator